MKKIIIPVIILLTVLFSCKDDTEKKAADLIQKIPTKELYNTGTLSCKIDGEAKEIHSNGIMTDNKTGMQSCIADDDNFQVQIIFPKTLQEGETSTNCTGLVMTKKPMEIYQNIISNKVTITKRSNKMVAGTFEFKANYSVGNKKIVEVTEGKFEAEIIN
jgi:hypothetical protein